MIRIPTLPARRVALGAALGAATLLGACGGDNGGLTKAEYVSKGDAICKQINQKINAMPNPKSLKDFASQADEVVKLSKDGLERFRDLDAPDELEAKVGRYLNLLQEQTKLAEQIADAAREGDTAKIQEIGRQLDANDKEADKLAAEIGFKDCGASS